MTDDLESARKELRKLKADRKKMTKGKANAAMVQTNNDSSDTIDLSDSESAMLQVNDAAIRTPDKCLTGLDSRHPSQQLCYQGYSNWHNKSTPYH
ncbi:hypothetical protein CROQUDRAFT_101857 [Cronartium quercuum f. sp. fusiforme G11]|uniref:Uncharacterized protein n=1 Tax=Cronartium quercuum f. sp. fusiforme G11 TaxID=708437 RepID=A0A9P6T589_9BASI|nr:hypothetical protein CROQUDRAFT_101857 [Cronartium quercuum f. sp. fusiforme G11]